MDKKDLIKCLKDIKNAKRSYRDEAVGFIWQNPELFPLLLKQVFEVTDPLHIRAAWTMELLAVKDISLFDPHSEYFFDNMHKVSHDSSVRPVSKTCRYLVEFKISDPEKAVTIGPSQIDKIIECNFDWLIGPYKVATQVHAMDTLLMLGEKNSWIREELKLILQRNTATGTKGYQAHARKLLKILSDDGAYNS